jgi:hypothetical protein
LFQSLVYKVFVLLLKKRERGRKNLKTEVPAVQKKILLLKKKVVAETKERKSKKKKEREAKS